eukprot:SAG11_NODE_25965_length_351_cov_1.190476_1_plen_95_part_01
MRRWEPRQNCGGCEELIGKFDQAARRTGTKPEALHKQKQPKAAESQFKLPKDLQDVPEQVDYGSVLAALESVTIPVNVTRKNVKTSADQVVTGMC